MIASIGLLVFMEDGFRIAFGEQGLTFAHNPYPTRLYDLAGLTVNSVQVAIIVCATVCLTLARPVHDAHPDRHRLARDRVGSAHRDELRRRCDQGALSHFRNRLGAGRRSAER